MKFKNCVVVQYCNTFGRLENKCRKVELSGEGFGRQLKVYEPRRRTASFIGLFVRRVEIYVGGEIMWNNDGLLAEKAAEAEYWTRWCAEHPQTK